MHAENPVGLGPCGVSAQAPIGPPLWLCQASNHKLGPAPWSRGHSRGVSSWHMTTDHCVTASPPVATCQKARGLAASRLRVPPSAGISLPLGLCQVSATVHRGSRFRELVPCVLAAFAGGTGGGLNSMGDLALIRQGPGSARVARMAGWHVAGFADVAAEIRPLGAT